MEERVWRRKVSYAQTLGRLHGRSRSMPKSRSHQPSTEFTTTSMKLRREIRDVLLPQITDTALFKQAADRLITSRTFHLNVQQIERTTFQVAIQYRSAHIGSTVAQLRL